MLQIKTVLDKNNERCLREHLAKPVYDDELPSTEEEAAIADAYEDIKNGHVYTLGQIKREFNL